MFSNKPNYLRSNPIIREQRNREKKNYVRMHSNKLKCPPPTPKRPLKMLYKKAFSGYILYT